jgi:uncharacterized protein YbjQ (UPF0145 family)
MTKQLKPIKMTEIITCPNCTTSLSFHLKLLNESKIAIINEYHANKASAYCGKCGPSLFNKYKIQIIDDKKSLVEDIQNLMHAIPVVSIHSPLNWDYDILDIVTGQTTTGMGILADFSADYADLLGKQSTRYNNKLKAGEDLCFAQLRKQALDLGGNAVIAIDIDYSEIGSKAMLMVCMTGTAIKLKNVSILGDERNKKIERLISLSEKLNRLSLYNLSEM